MTKTILLKRKESLIGAYSLRGLAHYHYGKVHDGVGEVLYHDPSGSRKEKRDTNLACAFETS